jgi:hypothetical protein
MDECRTDTIEGYNTFLESQKPHGGTISLYLFDHELSCSYKMKPIEEIEPMTEETFQPRGGTALLDAMGEILKTNDSHGTKMIILTDGEENSSRKYTNTHVKDLVEMRTKYNNWSFVYLGANQDVVLAAQRLGISPGQTVQFDTQRTPELFQALSSSLYNLPSTI